MTNSDRTAERMQALAQYIREHAAQPLTLAQLARRAHMSPTHLQRTFKRIMGVSPKAFHDGARLAHLKAGLKSGKRVLEALTEAGFESTSRAYGSAPRSLGMTPSAYRAGGAGEHIVHAFRDTAMGPLLMAATSRGVCFAQFGDGRQALIARLEGEFPQAEFAPSGMSDSSELDAWIDALEAHIAGSAPRPDLPLDLHGTAFQIRVWRFLLSIPAGNVVSYSEVARGIGSPAAARAAASACRANRIAVLVPCHRVLRGDGHLGGYRWGMSRKRVLIEQERARSAS